MSLTTWMSTATRRISQTGRIPTPSFTPRTTATSSSPCATRAGWSKWTTTMAREPEIFSGAWDIKGISHLSRRRPDPTDWFYGQHEPSFTTPNTTGIFGLTLMDNGDFRIFPAGVTCGTGSAPPCLYSTIPVFQINESTKTATLETFIRFCRPAFTTSLAETPSARERQC